MAEDITSPETVMEMIPTQTKVFFIFVLALILFIILMTLSLNDELLFFLRRMADSIEDLKDHLTKCMKGQVADEEFQQTTGRKKPRKRYRKKYNKMGPTIDDDDEDEDEEKVVDDDDSDDETVMAYWRMVENGKKASENIRTASVAVPKESVAENSLKLQLGFRYESKVGGVNLHVIKLGGLVGRVLKKVPWTGVEGVFVRLLLLTKDGLILNKEDSKVKKFTSASVGELTFDQHFDLQLPLCQINKVVLIVALFVVLSNKNKPKENIIKGNDNEGSTSNSDVRGNNGSCIKMSDWKKMEKKAVSWVSFGLNASSEKAHNQWTLMIEHSDEVKVWHTLSLTPT